MFMWIYIYIYIYIYRYTCVCVICISDDGCIWAGPLLVVSILNIYPLIWILLQSNNFVPSAFLILYVSFSYQEGFNKCPFQLLRSYKGHKENKSKIGQEHSSMQQADNHRHRPTP